MRILLPYFDNGNWGFVDDKMNVVIQPVYGDVRDFNDGLAVVSVNERYGYIGMNGEVIIEPKFLYAEDCCGDKAIVEDDSGYTVIDTTGAQLLPRHYNWLYGLDMSNEMFAAQDKPAGKWKVIDLQGRELLPTEMDDVDGVDECGWWRTSKGGVHIFRRGLEIVRYYVYEHMSSFNYGMAVVGDGIKTGVVDRENNSVLPIDYYDASVLNDKCIAARFTEDGDFALFHVLKGTWGRLRFDYCSDAGYNGLMFVASGGMLSLYDGDENCVLANLGEEVFGPYCGKYWMIWENETRMYYLNIGEDGVYRLPECPVSR